MKRSIAIVLMIVGLAMTGYGTYDMFFSSNNKNEIDNNSNNSFNLRLFSSPTDEEKSVVSSYLANKYGGIFEVVEHTTTFCINQVEDNDLGYDIDLFCSSDGIVDDIYKVRDSNYLEFYVKKVSVKEDVILKDKIKNSQSTGMYDSYVIYKMADVFRDTISDRFKILGDYSSLKILSGLGIEEATYLKSNKGYSLYDRLGQVSFDSSDLNLSLADYMTKVNFTNADKNLKVHVKYDYDLTGDNFQSIVKTIVEGNLVYYDYNILGTTILLEFNNKMFIEYSFNGELINLYSYDDKVTDLFPNSVYDKSIVLDMSSFSTDNGISYEEFMNVSRSKFNF